MLPPNLTYEHFIVNATFIKSTADRVHMTTEGNIIMQMILCATLRHMHGGAIRDDNDVCACMQMIKAVSFARLIVARHI